MTTSWGGTSIPDPTTINISEEHVGAQYITADGALNTDTILSVRRVSLEWKLITSAQLSTIYGKATTSTSSSLVTPAGTFTVLPVRGQTTYGPVGGASALYNISCVVRTTS